MTLLVLILLGCVTVTRLDEETASITCASSAGRNDIDSSTTCTRPQRRNLRRELSRFKKHARFKDALIYNIPPKMDEFRKEMERDFGKQPFAQPLTTDIFQKDICTGYWHDDYNDVCRKMDVLTYSKLRYPRRIHEYKCCPPPKHLKGHCKPVKIPVHVLQIVRPAHKYCRCVVWDFYFKTVGCSFEPDNSRSFRDKT